LIVPDHLILWLFYMSLALSLYLLSAKFFNLFLNFSSLSVLPTQDWKY
jgi:predicted CDP-diglyceride synthetase/phosphatidate cytidylyltransferase